MNINEPPIREIFTYPIGTRIHYVRPTLEEVKKIQRHITSSETRIKGNIKMKGIVCACIGLSNGQIERYLLHIEVTKK